MARPGTRLDAGGGTLFVWHTDVLPADLAAPMSEFVEQGSAVVCRALKGRFRTDQTDPRPKIPTGQG